MLLNDDQIHFHLTKGYLQIDPLPLGDCFQPASVDLTLGTHCIRYVKHAGLNIIDTRDPQTVQRACERFEINSESGLILDPGDFILGETQERITLKRGLGARVEGKSTLGRIGILVHVTAGFVDPGFSGRITLEFKNVGSLAVRLWPGQKIAQIAFEKIAEPLRLYGDEGVDSRYQNSEGVTEARVEGLTRARKPLPFERE